jgi:hypothetical protein
VDVVVKPSISRKGTWDLHDRLGRNLGTITQALGSERFVIEPEPESVLANARLGPYGALAEAMDAIASQTNGECELSPEKPKVRR